MVVKHFRAELQICSPSVRL